MALTRVELSYVIFAVGVGYGLGWVLVPRAALDEVSRAVVWRVVAVLLALKLSFALPLAARWLEPQRFAADETATAVAMGRSVLAQLGWMGLPLGVQLADRRRMSAAQRATAWNPATWAVALNWFGALSMLGWMWVTRPPWRRVVAGALSTAALVCVVELVDLAFSLALGVRLEDGEALSPLWAFAFVTVVAGALLALFEAVAAIRAAQTK